MNGSIRKASRPPRKFTWKELSQLNNRENAHVAYRGKVYDVSSFVSQHPGGMDQIMLGAGRDITQLFESYHKVDTVKILEKYYVGELVDNEMPVFPKRGEFYTTLKQRVDDYFKKNNIDPKIDYWMFLRYFIFLSMCFVSIYGVILFHAFWTMGMFFALSWGFFSAMSTMSLSHDSSHFCITHKPWVWKVLGSSHDFYHGLSWYVWLHQHTIGHHLYTNFDEADPDILTHKDDDIRRIKWKQKWLPKYFYQHVYIPLLYCTLGIKNRLQDILIVYERKNGNIRMNKLTLNQWLIFFGGKLCYIITHFYIPYQFMPLTTVFFYNLVQDIMFGYWLTLIFQLSHVVSEVDWPKAEKDNIVNKDWAELQVTTTQDYATDSWFWTVFTGALNHQTTHHLFPGIIQSHYPHITPIIRQTCSEFGVQYHYIETVWEALACHINHLRRLGQEPYKP